MELFAHPFSSYCWKALIALYEKKLPFEFRMVEPDHPENGERLRQIWPLGKFPTLTDGEKSWFEATIIVEYLDRVHPEGPRLVPEESALEVRQLDRVFDNYVMTPMNAIVRDFIRPEEERHPPTVAEAKAALDEIYDWLEARTMGREWAVGDSFSLADVAAAPSLFYADWVREIGNHRPALAAYRARLLARPSVVRCVDEARPYRHFFPPGAPDRD
jgi:glutathione S-transferase